MFMRLIVALLALFCIPSLSGATEVQLSDVVKALETPFKAQTKPLDRIQDFTAEFLQESHIASIDRTQYGEGIVRFKFLASLEGQPSMAKFRWEYRKPSIQEIISDGQIMWVYIPENRQVIESDISQVSGQQGQNPVTFLSGLGNLSRDFVINWSPAKTDQAGDYLLQLKPRENSQFIQQIEVVVSHKAVNNWLIKQKTGQIFPISATQIIDPNGNRTTIKFHDVQVNQNLADKLFSFTRPEGVELVNPGDQLSF
ncbi:MAG: outer membrane lipoprotein carrier protein LolA [Desulfuromusa sp.]|nr:outer membrane lipoprotein carrier protein LolA [Desulfuromusa sp.]